MYVHTYLCMCIYVYVYTQGFAPAAGPLLFDSKMHCFIDSSPRCFIGRNLTYKLKSTTDIVEKHMLNIITNVFDYKPYPSEPNKRTFFPFQLLLVKSFEAEISNALTQKFLVFKNLKAVFKLETLNIFKCSAPPLALL